MDFSQQDLRRLYGKQFFLIPEELEGQKTPIQEPKANISSEETLPNQPEEVAPKLPDWLGDQAIDWKLKPQARVAFVLQESEFTNRDLTTFFKGKVVEAHIDLKEIGFGVLPPAAAGWNFSDSPVPLVLLCQEADIDYSQPYPVEQVSVFVAPKLQEARLVEKKAAQLVAALSQLAQQLKA